MNKLKKFYYDHEVEILLVTEATVAGIAGVAIGFTIGQVDGWNKHVDVCRKELPNVLKNFMYKGGQAMQTAITEKIPVAANLVDAYVTLNPNDIADLFAEIVESDVATELAKAGLS